MRSVLSNPAVASVDEAYAYSDLSLTLRSEDGSLSKQLSALLARSRIQPTMETNKQSGRPLPVPPPARDKTAWPATYGPSVSRIQYAPNRQGTLSGLPPARKHPIPFSTPRQAEWPATPAVGQPSAYFPPQPPANMTTHTETALPLPQNSSLFLHSGFYSILGLANAITQYPSRTPPASSPRLGQEGGYFAASQTQAPRSPNPYGRPQQSGLSAPAAYSSANQTRKHAPANKRISVDMISRPQGFAHLCHASDADQAAHILTRWQKDGVGKLAEPAWVIPIKEAARARARAAGVAQVQANYAESRNAPLKVVNPSESTNSGERVTESFFSNVAVNGEHEDVEAPTIPAEQPLHSPRLRTRSDSSSTVIVREPRSRPSMPLSSPSANSFTEYQGPTGQDAPELPFKPSLETLERSASAAIFFEQLYHGLLKRPKARDQRLKQLEAGVSHLPESERHAAKAAWLSVETEHLRDLRTRVDVGSFAKLKTVGHGAFGVVTLVKEKNSGQLYAMKQLRKADMLRKGQEGHVRAERDFMTQASETARWIVRLAYSFQDVDHLFLIMEWMSGGDLLNLLIERDVFEESFARFYVAEMVLAIDEAHNMGFIHRDIKPDNFLFDSSGHLKLSDFGLATDFHWAHDGAYYDQQRKQLLRKHGVDLDDGDYGTVRRRDRYDFEGAGEMEPNSILTWRDKNRKKLAYSVVGTNNYMAPEVLRGQGYSSSCDWWSAGVICFEMLFGYPCFVSKSRHVTRQKILNWRSSLKFPGKPSVSREAQDFIERLLCEREDRLGSEMPHSVSRPNSQIIMQRRGTNPWAAGGLGGYKAGAAQIKAHSWFRGIDFSTIHLQTPPFIPDLSNAADTRYFEEDIDANPLAAPNGEDPLATKDPLLRDRQHGQHLLDVRKQLAFVGYTYKRPRRQIVDPRNGKISVDAFEDREEDNRGRTLKRETPPSSFIRSLSV